MDAVFREYRIDRPVILVPESISIEDIDIPVKIQINRICDKRNRRIESEKLSKGWVCSSAVPEPETSKVLRNKVNC